MEPNFFLENEARNGVRWNFLSYPESKEEATKMVLPLGCLLTPLKRQDLVPLPYEPVLCKSCRAVLSPYCRVDYGSRLWVCPFCITRNSLPPQYAHLTHSNLPAELQPQNQTVEYVLQRPEASPLAFVYVIDTSMPHDELEALRDTISQSLGFLPENSHVGFITFGSNITLWELGFTELHKSYVFHGHRSYSLQQLQDYLGVPPATGTAINPASPLPGVPTPQRPTTAAEAMVRRFIVPFKDAELVLTSIIDELTVDPWPTKQDTRPLRAAGAALELGLSLLEMSPHKGRGRVMLFVAGAVTKGPGSIVSTDLEQSIRTHNEIRADQAPMFSAAEKYYKGLSTRFVAAGLACDLFAGCLDQTGLTEMQSCSQSTGGTLLMVDRFRNPIFQKSLPRFFSRDNQGNLLFATNVTIEVQTDPRTKIAGIIGPCSSLNKPSPSVAEEEWGVGKTCAWHVGSIVPTTTYGFYFDVCGTVQQPDPQNPQPRFGERFVQVITSYTHADGTSRVRVATLQHQVAPSADPNFFIRAFDQDAAAVLIARVAVHMMTQNNNSVNEAVRFVDRTLIRFVKKFGTYTPNDPSSLKLSPEFSLFPQFMFHLRRSEFLQVFNSSPDETAFFRSVLERETCENNALMIQPTLHQYSFHHPGPQAVLLDSKSITHDTILVLDTYFDVLIHKGSTIASWVEQKFQDQPGYEGFRQLLEAPARQAQTLTEGRFPAPRFTDCNQHGSQARILTNRINPSMTYHTDAQSGYASRTGYAHTTSGEVVFTDDANMQTFMEHLKKLATQG